MDSFRSARLDTYHEVAYPESIGPVQVRPFGGSRLTLYEDGPAGDRVDRYIVSGGVQATSLLRNTYRTQSDTLGLNGLRHTMEMDARYTGNFESNRSETDVFSFDQVDSRGEFEEVFLDFRHRFETRSSDAGNAEPFTFLEVGTSVEYYPDASRDRGRVREQNHLDPMSWISTVRDPDTSDVIGDNWSAIHGDLTFDPDLPMDLTADIELEPSGFDLISVWGDVTYDASERLDFSLSHSYIRNLTETTDFSVQYLPVERWGFRTGVTYDHRESEFQERMFGLDYHLHDFTLGFQWHSDDRRDDSLFILTLSPQFYEGVGVDVFQH